MPTMAVTNSAEISFDHVRDVLVQTQPGEVLALKPTSLDAEMDDFSGKLSIPYGPARFGIYSGNGFILHHANGKLREDPFWVFPNLTFLRPPSYVLDSMFGVHQLFRNEPKEVLALARAHLAMPTKEFRRMFSNFMAFAAWCHYYPDVRRNPTDPTEPYKCERTGWREIELVTKRYDTDRLLECIDSNHRETMWDFALWQVPDVIVGFIALKAATESFVPDVKTFLFGYAVVKMISMNINNIWHDPAACHNDNNLCETLFDYLLWVNENFTCLSASIPEMTMFKTAQCDDQAMVNSAGDSPEVYGSIV